MRICKTVMQLSRQKWTGMAVVLCAVLSLVSQAVRADSTQIAPPDFQRQLLERSQAYLKSIQSHAETLSPEQRETFLRQAQNVVEKGLAKLEQPSRLVRKQAQRPTLPKTLVRKENGRNTFSLSSMKVVEFLQLNFHEPSELEVAVRVALPSRFQWERRFGVLTANGPFSGTIFGFYGFGGPGAPDLIAPPTLPRHGKSLAILLGRNALTLFSGRTDSGFSHLAEDAFFLSGFPRIAQTIVLRI